jgi:class 3 adenylate cyclase
VEPGPRVLAVLFADVSGSTSLYEKLGDRAALAAVEAVLDLLQRAVAAQRGRVVKTIGDEVMAVFESADTALQAAVDMQNQVSDLIATAARVVYPELQAVGDVRLGIRVGFHAGPVLEERGDVFGDTVNTAARLAGLANAGQILTSGPTAEALSALLRASTRDLDALPLKGKHEEIRVFEVLWQESGDTTMMAPRGARPVAAEPTLRVEHGGRVLPMAPGVARIMFGRDQSNDVVIADKMASRVHGRIERRRDQFYYVDLSTNGTYVTNEGDEELLIRRDQVMLRGRGRISFGHSSSDADAEVATFVCE